MVRSERFDRARLPLGILYRPLHGFPDSEPAFTAPQPVRTFQRPCQDAGKLGGERPLQREVFTPEPPFYADAQRKESGGERPGGVPEVRHVVRDDHEPSAELNVQFIPVFPVHGHRVFTGDHEQFLDDARIGLADTRIPYDR